MRVVLLKDDPPTGQVSQVGSKDGVVVPGDVIVAMVVRDNHYDVRSLRSQYERCQRRQKQQREPHFITVFIWYFFYPIRRMTLPT